MIDGEVCGCRAVDPHHIVAVRDGGSNKDENMEPKCHECHSRITAKERWKGDRGLKTK
jgi:DNA-directed RNA polymerase subunit RPC12/RpoP